MKRSGKLASRRGQTAVEYILLMGAVAFAVTALKKGVVDGMFAKTLPETVEAVRGEAALGGVEQTGSYYVKSTAVPQGPN